jgi:dihydroorotate dehydrogenase
MKDLQKNEKCCQILGTSYYVNFNDLEVDESERNSDSETIYIEIDKAISFFEQALKNKNGTKEDFERYENIMKKFAEFKEKDINEIELSCMNCERYKEVNQAVTLLDFKEETK